MIEISKKITESKLYEMMISQMYIISDIYIVSITKNNKRSFQPNYPALEKLDKMMREWVETDDYEEIYSMCEVKSILQRQFDKYSQQEIDG